MKEVMSLGDQMSCGLTAGASFIEELKAPHVTYDVVCLDKDGNEKWRELVKNTVMIPGKNDILNKYFNGSAYTAAWYMLLVGGTGTIANTDTLASHAGWTEQTGYTGNRQPITWPSASGGSMTASIVTFSINATQTILGAGICTVATGTSGVLYSAALFAASRAVLSGDVLNVTPTLSVS